MASALVTGAGRGIATEGRGVAFVWPGSHTKLIEVDPAGRIVRSHTTLAGELLLALARHTLLAASLPSWREPRQILEQAGLVVMARPGVALLSADELSRRRADFEAQKQISRGLRESAA